MQIGHWRAGFYSDSRFWDRYVEGYCRLLSRENPERASVAYHVDASDRVVPSWRNSHVGDIIADRPPGTACYVVRFVEPNKAFVLFTDAHLRYLLPARLRDNPRHGICGKISDGFLLTEPTPGRRALFAA